MKLASLRYALFFVLLLFMTPQTNFLVGAADITPPVINSVAFSQSTAGPNDRITLSVDVTDDQSGINYADASIYYYNTTCLCSEYKTYVYLDSYQGYNGTFDVNPFWPAGLYFIYDIYTEDNAGNYKYHYNGTDYISPELIVSGTIEDKNPPTVDSASFSQTTAGPNEIITVVANISDDFSGVNYAEASISYYNSICLCSEYKAYVYLDPSQGFSGTFQVNAYWPTGLYFIDYVYVEDNANNYAYYYNGSGLISPYLTVSGTTSDFEPPVVTSLLFDRSEATGGEMVTVSLNATDDISGLDYADVVIYYYNETCLCSEYKTYVYLDPSQGFTGTFEVNLFWSTGIYYADSIYTQDKANNYKYHYNGTEFTSPQLTVISVFDDLSSPTLTGLGFSQTNATVNGQVTLTAVLDDLFSGIEDVSAEIAVTSLGFDLASIFTVQLQGERFGNIFETTLQLDPVTYPVGSEITVNRVWGSDVGGNSFDFYANLDFSPPIVLITQLDDLAPPMLLEVGFNEVQVNLGDFIEVFVHAQDDLSGVGYVMADIVQITPDGVEITYGLNLTQNSLDPTRYSGQLQIGQKFGAGDRLRISLVLLEDMVGNSVVYFDGIDFFSQIIKIFGGDFQEIFLDVFHDQSSSQVNEEVRFEVKLHSTFNHDMNGVSLHVYIETPNNSLFDIFLQNLDLAANSVFTTTFTYIFDQVGSYRVSVILIDDLGVEWGYSFNWRALADGSTTDYPISSDDTISEEKTSTDTSATPPSLPIPAFELLFFIPVIATISILRKRVTLSS